MRKIYYKWSRDALECFESNQNYNNCDLYKVHGFHPNNHGFKKCNIPLAIKHLQYFNVPTTTVVKDSVEAQKYSKG